MSGKTVVVELSPMFLTNHIAGFLSVISLKKLSDQVDLQFTDKHQNFLQVTAITLLYVAKHILSTQHNKFAKSL